MTRAQATVVVLACLVALVAAVAVFGSIIAGCTVCKDMLQARTFVTPCHPQPSPSGEVTASVEIGTPDEDGYETWIVVIADRSGEKVFRARDAHSTAYGLHVLWESNPGRDRLRIVPPADSGTYFVMTDPAGRWTRSEYSDGIHDLIHPTLTGCTQWRPRPSRGVGEVRWMSGHLW